MIYIANLNRGGLCNRLLLYSHCISGGVEYGQSVTIINEPELKKGFKLDPIGNIHVNYIDCNKYIWKLAVKGNRFVTQLCGGREQDSEAMKELLV